MIYFVVENGGPVQPVINISSPLECCSFTVLIKVEDITAKGKINAKWMSEVMI